MYKSFFFFWQIKNSFVSHSNFVPWYWNKHKHIDQRNRIETPQKNPHTYCRLIHDKRGKTIHWIRQSLQQAVLGRLDATHERVKLAHFFTPYTKINSKWFKNLNVKQDTVQLLEKNISETFCDINHSDIFLDQSPKVKEISIKAEGNKWDLIKLKSLLCKAKETINKTNRKPTE